MRIELFLRLFFLISFSRCRIIRGTSKNYPKWMQQPFLSLKSKRKTAQQKIGILSRAQNLSPCIGIEFKCRKKR